MKALKVLGIINLVVIAITLLCIFGGSADETTGLWAIIMMGLAVAQSIVGICKSNTCCVK